MSELNPPIQNTPGDAPARARTAIARVAARSPTARYFGGYSCITLALLALRYHRFRRKHPRKQAAPISRSSFGPPVSRPLPCRRARSICLRLTGDELRDALAFARDSNACGRRVARRTAAGTRSTTEP